MTEKEFITNWTSRIWEESNKKFPADFIGSNGPAADNSLLADKKIDLPGKALVIGEEFFGAFEILTVDGNPVYHADNHEEAKFIIYSNREKVKSVNIPGRKEDIKSANVNYENYLDSIIKNVEADYSKIFPGFKNSASIINDIFRMLNLVRY